MGRSGADMPDGRRVLLKGDKTRHRVDEAAKDARAAPLDKFSSGKGRCLALVRVLPSEVVRFDK